VSDLSQIAVQHPAEMEVCDEAYAIADIAKNLPQQFSFDMHSDGIAGANYASCCSADLSMQSLVEWVFDQHTITNNYAAAIVLRDDCYALHPF
jgi:hypothetical protein